MTRVRPLAALMVGWLLIGSPLLAAVPPPPDVDKLLARLDDLYRYWPYGRIPRGTTVRSEYGTASRSGLLQLRIYV